MHGIQDFVADAIGSEKYEKVLWKVADLGQPGKFKTVVKVDGMVVEGKNDFSLELDRGRVDEFVRRLKE